MIGRIIGCLLSLLYLEAGICAQRSNAKGWITKLQCAVVDVIVSEKNNSEEYLLPRKESSDGTGFIIDENGYIVTNCHVIDSSEKIKIILHDGSEYYAKIVGKDERSDIALLKVDVNSKLPFVQFADSDRIEVGDQVLAIGNPFGFGKTVTSGIVSYKGRNLSNSELGVGGDLVSYIQTDAAVNYGNSGGPLFSYSGEVIGMITVFFSDGGHCTGINFAIPSNILKNVISQLRSSGKMCRSWLGISVSPLSKEASIALGLDKQQGGGVVSKVDKDSPASAAGLQIGDILLSIDNEKVSKNTNLEYVLSNLPVGKVIPVQILRHMVEMKLSILVGSRSDDDFSFGGGDSIATKNDVPQEKVDGLGLRFADLGADLRKSFEVPDGVNGVLVSNTGGNRDMAVGCVILTVNQIPVANVKALRLELKKMSTNKDVMERRKIALCVFTPQTKRHDYVAVDFNGKSEAKPESPKAIAK
ncbi:MAG: trypsin-like peptidase domain-containing protein [Holosporaceae bacterium]|nr:trypsin-like peptidase domain-containing protein [Holosporaceae bacterium]